MPCKLQQMELGGVISVYAGPRWLHRQAAPSPAMENSYGVILLSRSARPNS